MQGRDEDHVAPFTTNHVNQFQMPKDDNCRAVRIDLRSTTVVVVTTSSSFLLVPVVNGYGHLGVKVLDLR